MTCLQTCNSPLRGARRPEIFWTLHLVTSNFCDFYTFNEGHSGCPGPLACAPRTRVHPGGGACVQWPMTMTWQRASACVRACKRTARSKLRARSRCSRLGIADQYRVSAAACTDAQQHAAARHSRRSRAAAPNKLHATERDLQKAIEKKVP